MNWIGKIKDVIGIYLLWISLHFICSHLYARLCAGNTFISIVTSPFVVTMPHCVAMRWVIFKGAKVIEIMWILAGKWAIEQFIVKRAFPDGCSSE